METFSALLAICAGNSPVPGEFSAQRPVKRSFDVFFDLRLNKRLSKQSWGWWFETLSRPLRCHRNGLRILVENISWILSHILYIKTKQKQTKTMPNITMHRSIFGWTFCQTLICNCVANGIVVRRIQDWRARCFLRRYWLCGSNSCRVQYPLKSIQAYALLKDKASQISPQGIYLHTVPMTWKNIVFPVPVYQQYDQWLRASPWHQVFRQIVPGKRMLLHLARN